MVIEKKRYFKKGYKIFNEIEVDGVTIKFNLADKQMYLNKK